MTGPAGGDPTPVAAPADLSPWRHPAGAGAAGFALALRSAPFRRLWVAAVASRAGDVVQAVALPLTVLAITGSAVAVAGVVLAEGVGLLAGAAVAGAIVDRVPPRRLLVAVDVARGAVTLVLVASPSVGSALAVAVLLSVGTAVFSPAASALVPRLVRADALAAANGLQWLAGVSLQLVAAPLAGLLVAGATPRAAFAVNAVSFLVSAAILRGLPPVARAAGMSDAAGWSRLRGAWHASSDVPVLAPLLAVQALAALAVGGTSALLVVLARADGVGATGYGVWLAAIGVGALVGPVVVPLMRRLRPDRAVAGAYMVRGLGDVGLGLLRNGAAAGVLLGIYGANTSTGMVAFQSLVQTSVPAEVRGRCFALLDAVWQAGRLVSIALGGAVAATAGIGALYVAGGALLLVAGALAWTLLGRRSMAALPVSLPTP